MGRPKGVKDKKPRKIRTDASHAPQLIKERVEKTEKKEEISRIVNESFQYFPRKRALTNEEIAERLNGYFQQCVNEGQIPTVEDLALSLGTTRQNLLIWEHEVQKNPERAEMIQKAKEVLAGIDAKLVSEGKIPQVSYIFRAKNYFGMKDQQDVVVTPNNPLGENVDIERIKQKYLENAYGMNDDIPMLLEGEVVRVETPE